MLLPTFAFLLLLYGSWVILFPVIEIYESFFFSFFLGIRSLSSDIVFILSPWTDILEGLWFSLLNFFLIVITVGCCYFIFSSSELADYINLFLVSCFPVSSVKVFEEDLDLSNEGNLFSSISLFYILAYGLFKIWIWCFLLVCFQITNIVFDLIFCWLDQWNIVRHDPLFLFVLYVLI